MRAVLVASGPGAGLSPLTGEIPAAMVPVLDRPLLGHTVDLLWRQGIEQIAVALGRHGDIVARHFGPALDYRRDERALGTAGSVASCRELIGDETFLAIGGESLTDLDVAGLVERHRAAGALATLCVKRIDDPLGHWLVDVD